MSGFRFDCTPRFVPLVKTKHRRIQTKIPVPQSLPLLRKLDRYESVSMHGQLPVVWDRAAGFSVYDAWGNKWIDFTSTIFVANAGHGNPAITRALRRVIDKPLLHTYTYASRERADYLEYLIAHTPAQFEKAFLVSAGTEATEAAVKLMRMAGMKKGKQRPGIIAFEGNWHGRTMGAQMLSAHKKQKEWIGYLDPHIYHLPFPYPWVKEAQDDPALFFTAHMDALLREKKLSPDQDIAGFMIESYQGWGAVFYPAPFITELVRFAKKHDILVTFDEVQSGFGRTGKLFTYQHYGVEPDMVCCGKGASSSVPLSLVLGRKEIMDLPEIGSMSSTHSANPMACAAGLANLKTIINDKLVKKSERLGIIFHARLAAIQKRFPRHINYILGKGLLAGMHFNDTAGKPLVTLCDAIAQKAMQKGLLVVHTGRETIKLGPPLVITRDALDEGLDVLEESIQESIQE